MTRSPFDAAPAKIGDAQSIAQAQDAAAEAGDAPPEALEPEEAAALEKCAEAADGRRINREAAAQRQDAYEQRQRKVLAKTKAALPLEPPKSIIDLRNQIRAMCSRVAELTGRAAEDVYAVACTAAGEPRPVPIILVRELAVTIWIGLRRDLDELEPKP
jgi:hypothetical protein